MGWFRRQMCEQWWDIYSVLTISGKGDQGNGGLDIEEKRQQWE